MTEKMTKEEMLYWERVAEVANELRDGIDADAARGFLPGGIYSDVNIHDVRKIVAEDQKLTAAANALFKEGEFYHWWGKDGQRWDSDEIAREEFLAVVARVVDAYKKANTGPKPH